VRVLANSDNCLGGSVSHLFVVVGAQRTGTNLLRETLNTNKEIAMLGEVLTPSPAPAHWDNFCRNLPRRSFLPATRSETDSLLDQYFKFVQYRIRNHWEGNKKHDSHALGVDIKYNQLRQIAPANWNSSSPFILGYLRSRGITLIHTTRNVIHSAVSTLIASQRNVWHNYNGAVIARTYHVDAEECLAYARTILEYRDAFIKAASGCKVVNCSYESLIEDIGRACADEEIREAPGPLRDIAQALGCVFKFRYERRLKKAIDLPYSRLLLNYDDLVRRLRDSEFSALASTLE
jgi:LPS sulfotransferase NodH